MICECKSVVKNEPIAHFPSALFIPDKEMKEGSTDTEPKGLRCHCSTLLEGGMPRPQEVHEVLVMSTPPATMTVRCHSQVHMFEPLVPSWRHCFRRPRSHCKLGYRRKKWIPQGVMALFLSALCFLIHPDVSK